MNKLQLKAIQEIKSLSNAASSESWADKTKIGKLCPDEVAKEDKPMLLANCSHSKTIDYLRELNKWVEALEDSLS